MSLEDIHSVCLRGKLQTCDHIIESDREPNQEQIVQTALLF